MERITKRVKEMGSSFHKFFKVKYPRLVINNLRIHLLGEDVKKVQELTFLVIS
jgi:hypothetical protein